MSSRRAQALERVAAATVRLPEAAGQGVVVPGRMILTAAHCIRWEATGGMALGGYYVERVESGDQKILAQVYAVEPVADVAVLGMIGDDGSPEAEAFDTWCRSITPVEICTTDFLLDTPFPVWIRAHTRDWIAGDGRMFQPEAEVFWVRARERVVGGTSAGPCVTKDGRLRAWCPPPGGRGWTEVEATRYRSTVPTGPSPVGCSERCSIRSGRCVHGGRTSRTSARPRGGADREGENDPMAHPDDYVPGEMPNTLFCRRCLTTLVVMVKDQAYHVHVEETIAVHEQECPLQHPRSR